ncbi:uncharacterized protein LOC142986269 [Anticarsia gemmatalis]|uniref:uncharacterized protein LOC142986269 n=1 Tax=Anticarsia gemmatalis TaxID=129554 RepID=UPI003F764954
MTNFISKNIPRQAKMLDTKGILEILHTNNDVNMHVKLFSTLSAYLVSNEIDIDFIITYNTLYDKICNVLSNSPPRKMTVTFNFISALLYAVDEDSRRGKSLLLYAKNMIRSSGCLATMCELFTSCMMHQDAWRSLCRCLSETCRGVEANQSYCTHLVPTCIKRCSHMNIEVFLVLQSLLRNHNRNINLFIECNGISIIQREFLQHEVCLQLLAVLVQSSAQTAQVVRNTNVCEHLREFLRLYGPQSQLGQWSTVILYYVLGPKGSSYVPPVDNQIKEVIEPNKERIKEAILPNKTINKSLDKEPNLEYTTNTTIFFQNIMKEINHCGPQSDIKYLQGLFPAENSKLEEHKIKTQQVLFQNIFQRNMLSKQPVSNNFYKCEAGPKMKAKDLSFSFLQNHDKINTTATTETGSRNTERFERTDRSKTFNTQRFLLQQSSVKEENRRPSTPELIDFQPMFVSTPKKHYTNRSMRRHMHNTLQKSISISVLEHQEKRKIHKRKIRPKPVKILKRIDESTDKENKRSIGGWFFDTINESCTTLVKTVKNIFKPKVSLEETKTRTANRISDKDSSNCSYSFTNYMRKRDAILKHECSKKSIGFDFSMESNSCNTCNDTVALKHKLANDEYLRQTVRKLKLGINLYGCDFKKISKQLWPQQSYMTPVVLYNLYRKLIIK